jgi:acetyl esterase/lipase
LIQAGTREIFIGEARRAAAKAKEAGVEVTLDAWDGLIHVWQIWGDTLPEAREAVVTLGEFVRTHIPDRG